MYRSGFLLIAIGASLVMLGPAFSADSSDLFLTAYKDFQTAEKLEREAKPQDAIKKYRSARQILHQISKSSPDWQPLVVDYRLRKTQESIERLEQSIGSLPPPEPPEGSLPVADSGKVMPAVPVQAPVSAQMPTVAFRPPRIKNGVPAKLRALRFAAMTRRRVVRHPPRPQPSASCVNCGANWLKSGPKTRSSPTVC